ncbi:hypothetical protein [Bacillus sp. V3-13]|uniref:hypothetical protein n=1 Tax=Bacillus sp. V3-13 TaxID=2053728 RepID=UPI002152E4C5|nr:hypothetical protein [Bacillus sp. V3-13]
MQQALQTIIGRLLKKAISSNADTQEGVEFIFAEKDGKTVASVALFPAKSDAYDGNVENWIVLRYECSP